MSEDSDAGRARPERAPLRRGGRQVVGARVVVTGSTTGVLVGFIQGKPR